MCKNEETLERSEICFNVNKRIRGKILRRKALTRKRLVATESRRECACKRTGEPSVTFCERGGMTERYD